jgi:anti-sigma B factor antagonist
MDRRGVMKIEVRDGVTVIRFDAAAIGAVEGLETIAHDLRQLIGQSQPTKMIVDFSHVGFFSSQMLGLLVDVWRRLKDCGGILVISGINPNLTRVFRITSLDKVFQFYPDVESALKALAQPAGG